MTLLTGSNRALFFSFLPPSSKLFSRLIFSEELGFCLRDLSAGTAALSGETSHGTSTGVVQLTDLQRILSGLGQAPGSVSFITLGCLKNINHYTHTACGTFILLSLFQSLLFFAFLLVSDHTALRGTRPCFPGLQN